MTSGTSHKQRIRAELKACGMSKWGLFSLSANQLVKVIHKNEQILAAVAGRNKEAEGFFGLMQGMLVATDKRVLYVNRIPGFTDLDEISYDVVSGVNLSRGFNTASVKLYTRVATYTLSHANPVCAKKFADYIERHPIVPKNRPMPDLL